MTHPLTQREKVEREVLDAVFSGFEHGQCEKEWEAPYGREIASKATDTILTALASGSGDHAGLRRLADEAADFGVPAQVDPAVLNALLAENAALRGERDRAKERMHKAIDKERDEEIAAQNAELRATEAKRKLAEAVGLLEPFAKLADEEGGYREDDRLAWGLNAADINWGDLRAARTFLSKEAERG